MARRTVLGSRRIRIHSWPLVPTAKTLALLPQSIRAALLVDHVAEASIVLLLDRNQGFRSVMAERLERDRFRVVQALTAIEGYGICKNRPLNLLVADVSSLRPKPIEALLSVRQTQSRAKVLLISGQDLSTVGFLYPDLLAGAEFLLSGVNQNSFRTGRT